MNFSAEMSNYGFAFNVTCATNFDILARHTRITHFKRVDRVMKKRTSDSPRLFTRVSQRRLTASCSRLTLFDSYGCINARVIALVHALSSIPWPKETFESRAALKFRRLAAQTRKRLFVPGRNFLECSSPRKIDRHSRHLKSSDFSLAQREFMHAELSSDIFTCDRKANPMHGENCISKITMYPELSRERERVWVFAVIHYPFISYVLLTF